MDALEQHKGKSTDVVDAIIGGVIGLSSLVVIIVAIVINRRPCHKGILIDFYNCIIRQD